MADEEDQEWEIRKVLKERRRGKKIEYLIDWKPIDGEEWDPTWEPAELLSEEALQAWTEEKAKAKPSKKKGTTAKKKRKGTAASASSKNKRKAPASKKAGKKGSKKENNDDDNMEDEGGADEEPPSKKDDAGAEDAGAEDSDAPKAKRQKTDAKAETSERQGAESSSSKPRKDGDAASSSSTSAASSSSPAIITGVVSVKGVKANGTASEPSYNIVDDDDDDPALYPDAVRHMVPSLSSVPLERYGMPKGSSRLENLQHFYGTHTVQRLAGVLKHPEGEAITEATFETETGQALSDLLLRGAFDMKKGVPNRYLKRLRSCVDDITAMIADKFANNHRLAGDCKNIYEVQHVELAEVQKRGSTLDFSLNWWRNNELYPVLERVAYHALWYRTVVKALGQFFGGKMKCEWVGLLHSPAGAKGQHVHRDGRRKDKKKKGSVPVSSETKTENSEEPRQLFFSPDNPSVPCVPHSITVCVPLCDIKQVTDDADSDADTSRRHNGGTELFPGSHMSSYLSEDKPDTAGSKAKKNSAPAATATASSAEDGSNDPDKARNKPLDGPYPKTVVLSKAGDCLGWGFDFAHNGGPNSSDEPRQVMYFVYHLHGTAGDDENIKQFKDAKTAGSTLFIGNYCTKDEYVS